MSTLQIRKLSRPDYEACQEPDPNSNDSWCPTSGPIQAKFKLLSCKSSSCCLTCYIINTAILACSIESWFLLTTHFPNCRRLSGPNHDWDSSRLNSPSSVLLHQVRWHSPINVTHAWSWTHESDLELEPSPSSRLQTEITSDLRGASNPNGDEG